MLARKEKTIADLPVELITYLLSLGNVNYKELLMLSSTSKQFAEATSSNILWEKIYQQMFRKTSPTEIISYKTTTINIMKDNWTIRAKRPYYLVGDCVSKFNPLMSMRDLSDLIHTIVPNNIWLFTTEKAARKFGCIKQDKAEAAHCASGVIYLEVTFSQSYYMKLVLTNIIPPIDANQLNNISRIPIIHYDAKSKVELAEKLKKNGIKMSVSSVTFFQRAGDLKRNFNPPLNLLPSEKIERDKSKPAKCLMM